MSDSGKHLRNKFSRFEPGIQKSDIDERWTKMKDLIPQKERKKRGFFKRYFSCLFVSGALLLCLIAGTTALLYRHNGTDKIPVETGNETTAAMAADRGMIARAKPAKSRSKKNNAPKATKTVSPVKKTMPLKTKAIKQNVKEGRHKTNQTQSTRAKTTSSGTSRFFVAGTTLEQATGINLRQERVPVKPGFDTLLPRKNDPVKEALYKNASAEQDTSTVLAETYQVPLTAADSTTKTVLTGTVTINTERQDTLTATAKQDLLKPGKHYQWELEALPGFNRGTTAINTKSHDQALGSFDPFVGAGIRYNWKQDLAITSALCFGVYKLNYTGEGLSYKRVTGVTPVPGTIAFPDTMFSYLEVNSETRILPGIFYSVGLSAEYKLYEKNNFSISGSAGIAFSSFIYRMQNRLITGSDTLYFLKTSGSAPLTGIIDQNTGGQEIKKIRNVSLGIMPALSFGYQATSRMRFVLRASYLHHAYKPGKQQTGNISSPKNNLLFGGGVIFNMIR